LLSPGSLARLALPFAVVAFAATSATTASADSPEVVAKARRSEPVRGRIVGGNQVPVTAAPWQVRVNITLPAGRGLCGGSILDATTVMTAAHCVTNTTAPPNTTVAPGRITVDAGISRFNPSTLAPEPQPGDSPQTVGVAANRVHPGFPRTLVNGAGLISQFVDDVAILTLSSPLDLSGPAKQPIPLAAQNIVSAPGTRGTVTGFGEQTPPAPPNGNLFALEDIVQDDSLLPPVGPLNALFVVGATPAGSFCAGDSGGALRVGGAQLGIVSSGFACGPSQANVYTDVSAGEVQQFIRGNNLPPLAPRGGRDVTLSRPASPAPRRGDTLTCSAGTWSNAPEFTYVFVDTSRGRELQRGPSNAYRVTGISDARATISCRAQAANAGGVGLTPPTEPFPAVVAAPRPRLSLSLGASAVRVRRGERVAFTVGVRNRSRLRQTNVRRCVRLSSRFTLVRRGRGRVSRGRLCYRASSLRAGRVTRRRFVVRIDRDARLGRLVVRASARSSQGAKASARRTLRVRRGAARRSGLSRGPFVTG